MKKIFLFLTTVLTLGFVACQSDDSDSSDSKVKISVDQTQLVFASAGQSLTVQVTADPANAGELFALSSNENFSVSITGMTITVTAPLNLTGAEITGTLAIGLKKAGGKIIASIDPIPMKQAFEMNMAILKDQIGKMSDGTSLSKYDGVRFEGWVASVDASHKVVSVIDDPAHPATAVLFYNVNLADAVGKKIAFTLESSAISSINGVPCISNPTITKQSQSAVIAVPEVTIEELNSGKYSGYYVCLNEVKAQSPFVLWFTSDLNAHKFADANNRVCEVVANSDLQTKYVSDLSGNLSGMVFGSKIYPCSLSDIAAVSCDPYSGEVSVDTTNDLQDGGTYYIMIHTDQYYYMTTYQKSSYAVAAGVVNQRTGKIMAPASAQIVKLWKSRNGDGHYYIQIGSKFLTAYGKTNGYIRQSEAGASSWRFDTYKGRSDTYKEGWAIVTDGGWPQAMAGETPTDVVKPSYIRAASSLGGFNNPSPLYFVPVVSNAYDAYVHPEKQPPLTLPYTMKKGTNANEIYDTRSMWAWSLGKDYSDASYKLKCGEDSASTSVSFYVDSAIGDVTFGVRMSGGASTTHFLVESSLNGTDYTELEQFEIAGAQNSEHEFKTTKSFDAACRYVRLRFVKGSGGSNVALGYATITKAQ